MDTTLTVSFKPSEALLRAMKIRQQMDPQAYPGGAKGFGTLARKLLEQYVCRGLTLAAQARLTPIDARAGTQTRRKFLERLDFQPVVLAAPERALLRRALLHHTFNHSSEGIDAEAARLADTLIAQSDAQSWLDAPADMRVALRDAQYAFVKVE